MRPDENSNANTARLGPHLLIWLLAALLLVAVWVRAFQMIGQYRGQAIADAGEELVNLGRAGQEHAERTFQNADKALRLILWQYREKHGQVNLQAMSQQGVFDSAVLVQIAIIDAQGILRASTLPFSDRIDLSDREHFKIHKTANTDELFISRPVRGRNSNLWSIQLSRRITDKKGAFAGVVVASLDPVYFTSFYRELKLGAQPLAMLFGLDGFIRARRTAGRDDFDASISTSPVFRHLAQGEQSPTLTYPSVIDGIERTYHFRKLPSFPLVVAIGMETSEIFAGHELKKTNMLRQAGMISLLLLTLAIISSWYLLVRQRSMAAQERTLRQLQSISSRVPGMLYQYVQRPDGRSRLTFASAGIRDIYRLNPADVVMDASQVCHLTHPDDVAGLRKSIKMSAQKLTLWSHVYRVRFDDGTVRWLSGSAMPERQDDGSVIWDGYLNDVTEDRQLKALLDAQQAKIQATLEAIPDLLFELGLDGRYHAYHAHCADLLATPPENFLGKLVSEVLPAEAAAIIMAALQEAHAEGRSVGQQYSLDLEVGKMWFELSVARKSMPLDEAPRFIVLVRDITESRRVHAALRASEAREHGRSEELARLLDATPAAVWLAHDAQANVITGNHLSHEWLGIPEGSNVSPSTTGENRLWTFVVRHNGVELAPAEMPLQRAAAGVEVRDYEFEFAYHDGTHRHVLGNAMPLFDERQRPRGAIAAFVDITARKNAELAMQAAKTEAEQANLAKSRFLAAASHDLRQPLSALSIYVTLLRDKIIPADRPLLANMTDCLGNLTELLSNLLDLSKLQAEVVKPNVEDFSVAEMLAGLASVHAPEARLKNLRLRCVSSRLAAHTDPVLFRRIVGNLIANAIRYTESGAIVVGCRRLQGKTWIEVRDSGIGIAADKTTEIFEEFRQLGDEARTRGSGLGLAIVARTAALLGLEIRVWSQPGRGSVFAIELPVAQQPAIPVQTPHEPVFRMLRIALVEDNLNVRQALVMGLAERGHQVFAGASGTELRAALGDLVPDVVIADYRLAAGETGCDVIAVLRASIAIDLPALLLTGDTDPTLMRSMSEHGIVVLHKPVDLEALQSSIGDLTHQRPA